MGLVEKASLGVIPLAPVIRHLVNSTEGYSKAHVPKTPEALDALVDKLVEGQKVNPNIRLRVVSKPGQSTYSRTYPWTKVQREHLSLAPNSNPLTIAHEIGHAIQPNKVEKYLNIVSGLSRIPVATALPSILALTGGLSKKEEPPVWAKAAPWLGGAQLAAVLGEETRANIRALKLLKEKGINTTTLQKLRQFVPSLSYLGRASLLVGAPIGILKGLKMYEQARKTDTPYTFDQLTRMSPDSINETLTPNAFKEKWQDKIKK